MIYYFDVLFVVLVFVVDEIISVVCCNWLSVYVVVDIVVSDWVLIEVFSVLLIKVWCGDIFVE